MPNGTRVATLLAVAASVAAAVPALGQSFDRGATSRSLPDLTSSLARPDGNFRPRFPESQGGLPPPGSWAAVPAPRAAPSLGGIMTEQQARDHVAAAGFADVRPLQPGYHGTWTGYASDRGRPVRVTVDPQGNISTRQGNNSSRQVGASTRR
jgi:hypothetical protein